MFFEKVSREILSYVTDSDGGPQTTDGGERSLLPNSYPVGHASVLIAADGSAEIVSRKTSGTRRGIIPCSANQVDIIIAVHTRKDNTQHQRAYTV